MTEEVAYFLLNEEGELVLSWGITGGVPQGEVREITREDAGRIALIGILNELMKANGKPKAGDPQ